MKPLTLTEIFDYFEDACNFAALIVGSAFIGWLIGVFVDAEVEA